MGRTYAALDYVKSLGAFLRFSRIMRGAVCKTNSRSNTDTNHSLFYEPLPELDERRVIYAHDTFQISITALHDFFVHEPEKTSRRVFVTGRDYSPSSIHAC